jgi:UDP-N-acetylglucosamine transferase subunit ALG13
MKNFAIRTFVVALAVIGFSASSISTARASQAKVVVSHPGVVSTPATMCAPGSTCGMD